MEVYKFHKNTSESSLEVIVVFFQLLRKIQYILLKLFDN